MRADHSATVVTVLQVRRGWGLGHSVAVSEVEAFVTVGSSQVIGGITAAGRATIQKLVIAAKNSGAR